EPPCGPTEFGHRDVGVVLDHRSRQLQGDGGCLDLLFLDPVGETGQVRLRAVGHEDGRLPVIAPREETEKPARRVGLGHAATPAGQFCPSVAGTAARRLSRWRRRTCSLSWAMT